MPVNVYPHKSVVRQSTGRLLLKNVYIADTLWRRLKGLLGSENLSMQEGLLLIPCNSIHTIGMRYAIDAVFLNDRNEIIRLDQNVQPGKLMLGSLKAKKVLETGTGFIIENKLQLSDRLEFID